MIYHGEKYEEKKKKNASFSFAKSRGRGESGESREEKRNTL